MPDETKGPGEASDAQQTGETTESQALDVSAAVKSLALGSSAQKIARIEQLRGSRVLSLVYNESASPQVMIMPAVLGPLEELLHRLGKQEKVDVFLRTTGGMTEVPWRIISLLREFAEEVGVIVSGIAYSGGTHIAIAADELVMTPFSVIGSVDPTRRHPLLPKDNNGNPIPTSVQDLKHCIDFISEQLGDNTDAQSLAQIISELFHYVDPLAIGALEQSYNLSRLISEKALATRRERLSDETAQNVVDTLAGRYYSHSFLISRSDVETDLHLPVMRPDDVLSHAIYDLQGYYNDQFKKAVFTEETGVSVNVGAFAETSEDRWVIAQVKRGNRQVADPWVRLEGETQ